MEQIQADGIGYVRMWADQTPFWTDFYARREVEGILEGEIPSASLIKGSFIPSAADGYIPQARMLRRILKDEITAMRNVDLFREPHNGIRKFIDNLPQYVQSIHDENLRRWAEGRVEEVRAQNLIYSQDIEEWLGALKDQEMSRPDLFRKAGIAMFRATSMYDQNVYAARATMSFPSSYLETSMGIARMSQIAPIASMAQIAGARMLVGL